MRWKQTALWSSWQSVGLVYFFYCGSLGSNPRSGLSLSFDAFSRVSNLKHHWTPNKTCVIKVALKPNALLAQWLTRQLVILFAAGSNPLQKKLLFILLFCFYLLFFTSFFTSHPPVHIIICTKMISKATRGKKDQVDDAQTVVLMRCVLVSTGFITLLISGRSMPLHEVTNSADTKHDMRRASVCLLHSLL